MGKRVVITGTGATTGFGIGADLLWGKLIHNKNAIRLLSERMDASSMPVKIASDVPMFEYHEYARHKPDLFYPLPESFASQFSLITVNDALDSSGLSYLSWDNPERVGVFIADREQSSICYVQELSPLIADSVDEKGKIDRSLFYGNLLKHNFFENYQKRDFDKISHMVPRRMGIEGANLSVGTACASGNNAIGEAFHYIHEGDADIIIAGGTFELDLLGMVGFTRLEALTTNVSFDQACRPFDRNRNGFVMGSGCGIVVMEELEHARKRNAPILGEVLGYGGFCDAYRATDPHPEAEGAYSSIKAALDKAKINPEEVGYIGAHGTSTKLNDRSETIAIKRIFGEYSKNIPISASKSMIGHTIMAAGAIQGVIAMKTFETNMIHPTRNWIEGDDICNLDYVPGEARELKTDVILSNSFGFGGQNACIVYKRFSG